MLIKDFEDKELGRIIVRTHSKARHIILRTGEDALYITTPQGCSEADWNEIIEKHRKKLLANLSRIAKKQINLDFKIDTEFYNLSLEQGNQDRFMAHSELGIMKISCPPTARFEDDCLQQWLRKVIEESLRKNARIVLTQRLKSLSVQHQLPFNSTKINSSKGRWGSCSAKKDINLSFYLILLPARLIDYVLLHELSHTKEMNHGERFWKLLNQLTNDHAMELRKELRQFQTTF